MINVDVLVFSPFQENTYILSDATGECVIVDPGCLSEAENESLVQFIDSKGFRPVKIIFTHLHLDHVFGSRFVKEKYGIPTIAHANDAPVLANTKSYASMFGIGMNDDPASIDVFIGDGDVVSFGNSSLKAIHAPGHSPGSIVFYSAGDGFCIAGDVLFRQSIGRTDLPGGDYQTLIDSINSRLMVLPDDTKVYPGHGPATTIGFERNNNPYL
jgi:glyoxylase-like metal-dependent hydrolase (beta-lactamase superfamily II)